MFCFALKSFLCPSTRNYLRTDTTVLPDGRVMITDLMNNADNWFGTFTNGHSYEVFAFGNRAKRREKPKAWF